MVLQLTGRRIVKGRAAGSALVSKTPFSFLGDADIRTGLVVGQATDIAGQNLKGRILVVPGTRGSAGAWRFLYQLYCHGTHPVAIVASEVPDPSVVQGAILAGIPIVAELSAEDLARIPDGAALRVEDGGVLIEEAAA